MRNIIILGGNGYVGRELTAQWLAHDPRAEFWIVCRSGKNCINNPRVHVIEANARDVKTVESMLPQDTQFAAIIDLVGDQTNMARNVQAAKSTLALAKRHAIPRIGYIAGCAGNARYRRTKRSIVKHLRNYDPNVVIINPSIIYGKDRNDALVRLVPLFRRLSRVCPCMAPLTVDDVASELLRGLTPLGK